MAEYRPVPALIPVGLVLLTPAIRERELPCAITASPSLSPNVLRRSRATPWLAISRSPPCTAVPVVGMWIVGLLHAIWAGPIGPVGIPPLDDIGAKHPAVPGASPLPSNGG